MSPSVLRFRASAEDRVDVEDLVDGDAQLGADADLLRSRNCSVDLLAVRV